MSLHDRVDYGKATFDEASLAPEPFAQFRRWYESAGPAGVPEPNAMTLATVSPSGVPSARVVLLKEVDPRGFVFFTDYRSRKAAELAGNPNVAATFFWQQAERQVRITGQAERVSAEESDRYFATRPRDSQVGAWASQQSAVLDDRGDLERAVEAALQRFGDGPVPRPPHWGGFRIVPDEVEFWQGRASRLHDRLVYRKDGEGWRTVRLSP